MSTNRIKPLKQYKYLIFLNSLFITFFIICDITAFRMTTFFGHEIPLSGLIIVFLFSIGDIIAEAYGYQITMNILKSSIICQMLFGLIIASALLIAPSPFGNTTNAHYTFTFKHIIRTNLTSCFSVTSGMLVNGFLISKLKIRMNGKRFWIRTLLSSAISEIVLCTVAYLILFIGIKDIPSIIEIIYFVWGYKIFISILMTPITSIVGKLIKTLEGSDVYDYGISYNPLRSSQYQATQPNFYLPFSQLNLSHNKNTKNLRFFPINDKIFTKERPTWEE